MKYELTEEEAKSLFVFLNRVNLTGQEVPVFNKLVNIFQNPITEEVKGEEKKK